MHTQPGLTVATTGAGLFDKFDIKNKKLVWLGSLEELQILVANELKDDATDKSHWKSPSGGTWCAENDVLSATWHARRNNILFKGTLADQLIGNIYQVLNAKFEAVPILNNFLPCMRNKSTVEDKETHAKNNSNVKNAINWHWKLKKLS